MKKSKLILFGFMSFLIILSYYLKSHDIKTLLFKDDIYKILYLDKNNMIYNNKKNNMIFDLQKGNIKNLNKDMQDEKILKVFPDGNYLFLKENDLFKSNNNNSLINDIQSISIQNDCFIVKKDNKYGVLNEKFEIIIPFKYDFIDKGDTLYIAKVDNKYGYINDKNKVIVPFEYEVGLNDKKGKMIVLKNNKAGVIDSKNKIIIPFEYDNFINFEDNFIGNKNSKFYFITKDFIKELDGSWYGIPGEKSVFYEKNGKFGLLNVNGEKITENIYEELGQKNIEAIIFKKDGKYGLLNQKGEIIYKNTADYISPISEYFFSAGKDNEGVEYIVNSKGKTILKNINYLNIFEINKNYLLIQDSTGYTLYDKNGTNLLSFKELIFHNKFLIFYRENNHNFYIKL